MSTSLLRRLAQAYAEQRIDRRTYIHERRRLIDEAVAGVDSKPPQALEGYAPASSLLEQTIALPREEDE